jgi:tRNA (Thr-GGU) A37 N-methylase
VFTEKNGTPRQGLLCTKAKGVLPINYVDGAHHAVEGLESFSHVWLMFIFHENATVRNVINKIAPPRLEGKKVGIFATR